MLTNRDPELRWQRERERQTGNESVMLRASLCSPVFSLSLSLSLPLSLPPSLSLSLALSLFTVSSGAPGVAISVESWQLGCASLSLLPAHFSFLFPFFLSFTTKTSNLPRLLWKPHLGVPVAPEPSLSTPRHGRVTSRPDALRASQRERDRERETAVCISVSVTVPL